MGSVSIKKIYFKAYDLPYATLSSSGDTSTERGEVTYRGRGRVGAKLQLEKGIELFDAWNLAGSGPEVLRKWTGTWLELLGAGRAGRGRADWLGS